MSATVEEPLKKMNIPGSSLGELAGLFKKKKIVITAEALGSTSVLLVPCNISLRITEAHDGTMNYSGLTLK